MKERVGALHISFYEFFDRRLQERRVGFI